jgi:hypothetical protein
MGRIRRMGGVRGRAGWGMNCRGRCLIDSYAIERTVMPWSWLGDLGSFTPDQASTNVDHEIGLAEFILLDGYVL